MYHDIEVSQVVIMWDCTDTRDPTALAVSLTMLYAVLGGGTCGSAINLSVSFTIRFGKAAIVTKSPCSAYVCGTAIVSEGSLATVIVVFCSFRTMFYRTRDQDGFM